MSCNLTRDHNIKKGSPELAEVIKVLKKSGRVRLIPKNKSCHGTHSSKSQHNRSSSSELNAESLFFSGSRCKREYTVYEEDDGWTVICEKVCDA